MSGSAVPKYSGPTEEFPERIKEDKQVQGINSLVISWWASMNARNFNAAGEILQNGRGC
jgi:hypothetical protein